MDIKVLSTEVSSLIAAGEVIESPFSVVKELIENSIDAGSSRIIINTTEGGTRSLYVSDDGRGIPSDQVSIAFKRYATSKVSVVRDLDRIETLGFRGEALFSIAAVSNIKVITKFAGDDFGTEAIIRDGKKTSQSPIGVPTGTTIKVEDLFSKLLTSRI